MADGAATAIDEAWLRANPLPKLDESTDKNSRGHVVAIGGSRSVPGGLLLTGEAALRAGAGKVQLATVESCAIGLGIAMPEAGIVALAETADGEIDAAELDRLAENLARCDSIVVGPAMTSSKAAGKLLDALLGEQIETRNLLLDAVTLHAVSGREEALRAYRGQLIITPNPDEIASLLDCDEDRVAEDPSACAREAVERLGAVTVCKGSETYIAAHDGALLYYEGGGVGLATGGSGDILAGIIAGLIARGAEPRTAAAWGVWLHGTAGRQLAQQIGPVGFLARELLPMIPSLVAGPG